MKTQGAWVTKRIVCCTVVLFMILSFTRAQLVDRICRTDYNIDPDKAGELSVELDNISFFKDNEFTGSMMKGYTLPGMWLQPKAVFYPLKNIKLELGVHALIYSGAYKFPNYAYQDISKWKGDQFQRGTHILPFFRAQLALSHVNLVLGNIYGGANHGLIEPLYNPELNLTADPEAGFQLLYDSRHFDMDIWVNWQSFIFDEDTHQEAFTVGMSSRIKFNQPDARFHYYVPVQLMAQHRGGEQYITDHSVQTLMNAATGLGIDWNVNRRALKCLTLDMNMTGYYQESGTLFPLNKGFGLFSALTADFGDIRVKGGYWSCKDFISLFGIPYFGAVSTKNPGAVYDDFQTAFLSVEYSRTFGKHYAFGAKADVYQAFAGNMWTPEGSLYTPASSTNFAFGVYLRVNPSFLIKKFKI